MDGISLGSNPLVVRWVRGLTQSRPVRNPVLPTWRLEFVLKALTKAPYEPMRFSDIKFLALKTVYLVAITSARRVSELQALGSQEPYLVFGSNGVTLATNIDFIPKVNTAFHTS